MRLIDADAFVDFVKRLDFEGGTKTRCQAGNEVLHIHMPQIINQAHTIDAVPVVRCKDCRFYENHKRKIFENCVRNKRLIPMLPNDFCSHGERREENADN